MTLASVVLARRSAGTPHSGRRFQNPSAGEPPCCVSRHDDEAVCDCRGRFGLIRYYYWLAQFCSRCCRTAYRGGVARNRKQFRSWFSFLIRGRLSTTWPGAQPRSHTSACSVAGHRRTRPSSRVAFFFSHSTATAALVGPSLECAPMADKADQFRKEAARRPEQALAGKRPGSTTATRRSSRAQSPTRWNGTI
jgi:hypothetical protein